MKLQYPNDIDPEMIQLCDALNYLPGIRTTFCCSGHGYFADFYVTFCCKNLKSLKLLKEAVEASETRFLGFELCYGNDPLGNPPEDDELSFWLGPIACKRIFDETTKFEKSDIDELTNKILDIQY